MIGHATTFRVCRSVPDKTAEKAPHDCILGGGALDTGFVSGLLQRSHRWQIK